MLARKLCGLCLEAKALCQSHLIPSGVYRLLGKDGPQNPVQVWNGSATYLAKEVKAKLLCKDCEELFSKHGETPVFSECSRAGKSFKLEQKILSLPLLAQDESACVFTVSKEFEPLADSLLYYSLSFIWRWFAGMGEWPGITSNGFELGHYEEKLRRYLLKEEACPSEAALFVEVHPDREKWVAASLLATCKRDGVHVHRFTIPGITFTLYLGGKISREMRSISINHGPARIITLMPFEEGGSFERMVKSITSSTKRGKLGLKSL